jgi:hypothetical protein
MASPDGAQTTAKRIPGDDKPPGIIETRDSAGERGTARIERKDGQGSAIRRRREHHEADHGKRLRQIDSSDRADLAPAPEQLRQWARLVVERGSGTAVPMKDRRFPRHHDQQETQRQRAPRGLPTHGRRQYSIGARGIT